MAQPETEPASQVRLAVVARRYYLAGHSKVRIGQDLGLSRFQVARLLEQARSSGVVRIHVGAEFASDPGAAQRVQAGFGLRHVTVVDAPSNDDVDLPRCLAAAAATLLRDILTPNDVLGIAWSRAVSAAVASVTSLPAVPVVQLTGSLCGPGIEDTGVELVRTLAGLSGGQAYTFYAPMMAPDAPAAEALRMQPEIARTLDRSASVTTAMVGIGRWHHGRSMVYDACGAADRQRLTELEVCAELAGTFLSAAGEPVPCALADRTIGVTTEGLRAVPEVIAIGYGIDKQPAVRAALRSGLVTSLLTHTSLAEALLSNP